MHRGGKSKKLSKRKLTPFSHGVTSYTLLLITIQHDCLEVCCFTSAIVYTFAAAILIKLSVPRKLGKNPP